MLTPEQYFAQYVAAWELAAAEYGRIGTEIAKALHNVPARTRRWGGVMDAQYYRERELVAEVESLRAAMARVRELHRPQAVGKGATCRTCWGLEPYPCRTVRALDGEAC